MKPTRIFYGYWVLLATFLITIISGGCGPISFSLFVTSLQGAFNWNRTEIMTGFTVFFISAGLSSPLFGRLVHRYGARKVVSLGALLLCVGFVILSQMSELWHFFVGYIICGLGFAALGPVITTLIVSNWFVRRRGMAIGALSTGAGTAGMIFTPIVFIYLLPNIGWSNTYLTFAATSVGLAIPLAIKVIRTKPADMGLLPDGLDVPRIEGLDEIPVTEGQSFKSAVGTPAFWLLAIAVLFLSGHMGVVQNQVPHLEDLGFSAGIVASSISIVSIVSTIGTLFFGWLSDVIKVKNATVLAISMVILGIIVLATIKSSSPAWLIWAYATMLGLGMGGMMPCISLLAGTRFGLRSYGTIFGALASFQMVGAGTAPIIYGYLFDRIGSYQWAFIGTSIMLALAIPAILAIRRPKMFSVS